MLAGWCWAVRDRERRPVSANGNGNGLSRLNAQETRQLLDADRAPLATVVDADGRSFIDYVGSWGPLIAGHAHPDVIRKMAKFSTGNPNTFGMRAALASLTR